jgi:hypothetical protein
MSSEAFTQDSTDSAHKVSIGGNIGSQSDPKLLRMLQDEIKEKKEDDMSFFVNKPCSDDVDCGLS